MTPAKRPSTRARQTPIQSLDDLQPDPLNANRGTDRGREALAAQSAHVRRGPLHRDRQAGAHSGGAQDGGTGQAPGAPDHGGAHHRPRTRCGAAGGSGRADRPCRLLKNTRIGLFSWPICSRPPPDTVRTCPDGGPSNGTRSSVLGSDRSCYTEHLYCGEDDPRGPTVDRTPAALDLLRHVGRDVLDAHVGNEARHIVALVRPDRAARGGAGLQQQHAASRSAVPVAWVAQTPATSACRLSRRDTMTSGHKHRLDAGAPPLRHPFSRSTTCSPIPSTPTAGRIGAARPCGAVARSRSRFTYGQRAAPS